MPWLLPGLLSVAWYVAPLPLAYAALLLSIPTTWLQRQAIYANNIPLGWGQNLDLPETFGFMHRQVTPFRVASGTASLYAWFILPLTLYAKNENRLINDPLSADADIRETVAFRLLTGDPRSRVVIYFHGNAGTLGMSRRTDAYRVISTGSSDLIHIITFDYRGFGKSTGSPTEEGVIQDAVSVVEWVMNVAKIDPSRIVLLGQSLGTAVAAAAAHHFINREQKVEFAGVILCASFSDAASVYLSYSIGGFLPILAPLSVLPIVRKWFIGLVVDKWDTLARCQDLARKSEKLRLTFIHSEDDRLIPYEHTERLFSSSVKAAGETSGKVPIEKDTQELGEGGSVHIWKNDKVLLRKELVKYGGHDNIMKWNAVIFAVYRHFGFD